VVAGETFDTQIAWPNDLMIEGCKVGGILSEIVSCGNGKVPVIGIGLNISASPEEMDWVTSLAEKGRIVPSPKAAAEALLEGIKKLVVPGAFHEIEERWRLRDATRGKHYALPDGRTAVAERVDEDGCLCAVVDSESIVVPSAKAIYGSGS
jgi:BirA family biotin operon repressor/biotin-[acetyl-CoA-carboxylase] ligase